jgi:hypothetical protein
MEAKNNKKGACLDDVVTRSVVGHLSEEKMKGAADNDDPNDRNNSQQDLINLPMIATTS